MSVLSERIRDKINELSVGKNSIIVLKGIPMKVVDPHYIEDLPLESIANDKFQAFFKIHSTRRFLTYEEFLLLGEFVVSQYDTVYVLNNNIYMEQYPLDLNCSEETRRGLLTHFMETEDNQHEDLEIGDLGDITSLYIGLREFNGYLLGAYCDESILRNTKVVRVNLFAETETEINRVDEAEDFIDLVEEADYIDLVKRVFGSPDEIYIRTANYKGDIYRLNAHLNILAENWSDWTEFFVLHPQEVEQTYEHRDEYTAILKKYWGYDTFRMLPVYDMAKLEEGKKEIVQVSQESIIANLVQQVENCESSTAESRDVFVTAPTGAGKSVMFQIPAIYLAEKRNLLTIVISPLIGLMNDQVKNLEVKKYTAAKTINSDISPIIKQEIIEKVSEGEYHILYISPETLLSRSDVEALIGNRTIGMIVIDEAHIVTTWGKQFRPDYWYLGDHIKKLRKTQLEKKGRDFVVATFTATAIYQGVEDMYTETINSLHMISPITYLGYVKRDDIQIVINKKQKAKGTRSEYELDKFEEIQKLIRRAMITQKKTLIYFPTVALIERCYEFLRSQNETSQVARYYGTLSKEKKVEGYEQFLNKEKLVMLATKAFGMGIDIDDIEIVAHFAPTGNVCDYVQEIGRVARRPELQGEALYTYDPRDFKHINRLHGLSTINRHQLVDVIRKVDELYIKSLNEGGRRTFTRKRNAMLLDAENFTYIFDRAAGDEDNSINKVKTALLTIQKDFESKVGFSPINVRPIPLFGIGYFAIDPRVQAKLIRKYPHCLEEIEATKHICKVMLDMIWRRNYTHVSFPKFKYMLYSKDKESEFVQSYDLTPALCVSVDFAEDHGSVFERTWSTIRKFIHDEIRRGKQTKLSEIVEALVIECNMTKYKAKSICEVLVASMDSYRKKFMKGTAQIVKERVSAAGETKYQFNVAVDTYFNWISKGYEKIKREVRNGELYLINDQGSSTKEISVTLGVLETMDVLTFKMIGGANSQLYIYINQIQSLKNIINNPAGYDNRLLDAVAERHMIAVKMLTYLYENDFSSDEIWDLLEDYFLGIIPERVKHDCLKENPNMKFD